MFICDKQLDVVSSSKLLGIIISSDLKWHEHTAYIVGKAKKRLWYLRRLCKMGASNETLVEMFNLKIRSLLEMAAPVFTGGLTQANIDDFEAVQKLAFRIILRGNYASYENARNILDQELLEDRRISISLKFAKKCTKHPKIKHLFKRRNNKRAKNKYNTEFEEPRVNSARGEKGPVSFLIRLLNNE